MLFLLAMAYAAPEICDGSDNDSDGQTDEAPLVLFADLDGDGRGDPSSLIIATSCTPGPNQSTNGDDCDDGNGDVYAGATESCNGIDDDCDGDIDEDGCGGFNRYTRSTSTYQMSNQDWTWETARSECQGLGYDMVIVDDGGENQWLVDRVDDLNSPYHWIGLRDVDYDDVFFWVDGSPIVYDNWAGGEPGSNYAHCVYAAGDGRWRDYYCGYNDESTTVVCEVECTPRTWYADTDGDGFGDSASSQSACTAPPNHVANADDCDDGDAGVHPSATEQCGGGDEDCNPATQGTGSTWYRDNDNDGFGDPNDSQGGCGQPPGYVADANDCDDDRIDVYPGAPEVCDGVDNDCDTQTDEGLTSTYYLDADGDGLGSTTPVQACGTGPGVVDNQDDCDDDESNVGAAIEWFPDGDTDGYGVAAGSVVACDAPAGSAAQAGDCDDGRGDVYPNAPEVCDGVDNDCDLQTDEGVTSTFYADTDDDGFGDGATAVQACSAPADFVGVSGDCDDARADVNPDADEVCDGVDNDCDTQTDEGVTTTFFLDADGDGFGRNGTTQQACSAPTDFVAQGNDCNDTDDTAYPGAPEVCDGDLETCGGTIDAGVTTTFYRDFDEDGHGDGTSTIDACAVPAGYATAADDCNDQEPLAWTGATELCDLVDNDCDGATDEGVQTTYWADEDNDGFGDPAVEILACTLPADASVNDEDCDDARPSAFPGAPETCNALDDDCDGTADNGVTDVQWYLDGDGDGWGDAVGVFDCQGPEGQVDRNGDCDDGNGAVNPDADEVCNGIDDDCDGSVDLGASDGIEAYLDLDGDGFGDDATFALVCSLPPDGVATGGDCDDTDADVNPDAEEVCNGVDDDCVGGVDLDVPNPTAWFEDDDGDGYGMLGGIPVLQCDQPANHVLDATDCDDGEPLIFPGADELCDGLDNDCNGLDDDDVVYVDWFADADGDGFGAGPVVRNDCSPAPGESSNDLDCDDGNGQINPLGTEFCNGEDDDCNGQVDDNALGLDTWYVDIDGDGHGDPLQPVMACDQPFATAVLGDDCDDTDDTVYPGATEVCDGEDDDCNELVDDGLAYTDVFPDADGDGFGDETAAPTSVCEVLDGFVEDAMDCDDTNADVNPDATEVPGNGIDDDCVDGDEPGIPPVPTEPIPTGDTGAPDGELRRVQDAGCACDAGATVPWIGWLRR